MKRSHEAKFHPQFTRFYSSATVFLVSAKVKVSG